MDYWGIGRGSIRSDALSRLAKISLEDGNLNNTKNQDGLILDNFSRLLALAPKEDKVEKSLSKVAISWKEYEVLISLCDSTNFDLLLFDQAKLLIEKFKLYLLELPSQRFSNLIFDNALNSTPWETLAQKLTISLINISARFDGLFREDILEIFSMFNHSFFEDKCYGLSNYLTLLGFIEGFTKNPSLIVKNQKSFEIFLTLDSCVDNVEFLNSIESYSNSININLEYSHILDHEIVKDFSPILFLERLCSLMCSMLKSIIKFPDGILLENILHEISKKYDDSLEYSECLQIPSFGKEIIKILSQKCIQKMELLDRGETYIVYSNFNRLKIGYLAKSNILQVIGAGVFTESIDTKFAKKSFRNCLEIRDFMLDPDLGLSVIQLGSLLVYKDEQVGSSLTRAFTSLISNPKLAYCQKASRSVGLASKVLSQDAVVTTIYALTNLLFVGASDLQSTRRSQSIMRLDNLSARDLPVSRKSALNNDDSQISSKGLPYSELDRNIVSENAIIAIIEISQACDDETISTLAVSILSQKAVKPDSAIGKLILEGLVSCAPSLPEREFIVLMGLLNRLSLNAFEEGNTNLLENVIEARVKLSHNITSDNPLYLVYLHEILQAIISKGDVEVLEHHRPHTEIREIGEQIGIHLKPLAELLPNIVAGEAPLRIQDTKTVNLFRNIWFNMVVHGYSINSNNTKNYSEVLERIAYNTPPLASELSWNRTETSLELNTVLRRGSSNHNVKNHKNIMEGIFEVHRTLSYPKLMFLSATVFLESLRVKMGDASTILNYFSDPSIKTSGVDKYIGYISPKICEDFIHLINRGANKQFSADNIADQLKNMLILCSHRVEELQDSAMKCCDLLINKVPSSLCHPKSLFALFDLLTLLFNSIIDADMNQYEPTTLFKAPKTGIELLLSDSYKWRKATFERFHKAAQNWLTLVLLKSSVDVRSLIQSYVADLKGFKADNKFQFGVSFALNMAGQVLGNDREMSSISKLPTQEFNTLPLIITSLNWRTNFMSDLMDSNSLAKPNDDNVFYSIRAKIYLIKENLKTGKFPSTIDVTNLLSDVTGMAIISKINSAEMIRYLVEIPFILFDPSLMSTVIGFWFTVMKDRSDLSILLLSEIAKRWETSIDMKHGIFSKEYDLADAGYLKQEYSPSDRKTVRRLAHRASKAFEIHLEIIRLFSSNFEATLNQSDHLLKLFTRFVEVGLKYLPSASLHPFARLARFELIRFSFDVLNYHYKLGSRSVKSLTELIFDASLSWFRAKHSYPYGSNVLKIRADYGLLIEVTRLLTHTSVHSSKELESKRNILLLFLDDEIAKFSVWLNPLNPSDTRGKYVSHQMKTSNIVEAYGIDPVLAINLAERYKIKDYQDTLQNLLIKNPLVSLYYPEAIQYFLGINGTTHMPSHYLLFWEPLSPIDCITLFLPPYGNDPFTLQYTMRSLEYHDVNVTFFYVPQIVQSLRFDVKGYVERFIIETAKVSQLFAHQIIWNMLANSYKDEDSTEPDSIKPVLDRIQENMTKAFSKEDLEFYKKEFGFFNEVTSISGKLKPYIKKSKAEKKVKIDEEMAKIKVESDVYLPSNPDGVIVDINRKSGKPLQSHAKAPFMATFKIKKEIEDVDENGDVQITFAEKWQSAIFKVGDDCRQDVLALQLISVFRSIWSNAGLDLFVYPYRVTATAPGCGVIDVLPNSTSRDMLGREAVNGLYEYFTTKFGPENSIEFQQARNNLIKSLAAYSIISYLLQFKDRHNGNIMYDDQGHILHIDFGFCFDIVPGGVKFEIAPFKLTQEMVMVLGGSNDTQAFKWFEELCVKGYLACRPHMETIIRCVVPMLESGLPCFKDTTIKKLRSRFVPAKSDKDASAYMRSLVKKSQASFSTKGYDEFQKITNGIPY